MSAGKTANACLGELDAEDAAPTGQLVEELLREAEDLHTQLGRSATATQARTLLSAQLFVLVLWLRLICCCMQGGHAVKENGHAGVHVPKSNSEGD